MATARTAREAWIDAGLDALAQGGPDAVRIESLARTLGVTKGGFYGYFADRQALLDEMLDTWERRSITDVVDQAEREGGDAITKARKAGALTFSRDLIPVDLAIRDWSRRDNTVARRLRRVDNRRMDYLRASFAGAYPDKTDLEVRCLLAFSAAIATHLIAVDHPGHTRAELLGLATRHLFAEAGPAPTRSTS